MFVGEITETICLKRKLNKHEADLKTKTTALYADKSYLQDGCNGIIDLPSKEIDLASKNEKNNLLIISLV